MSPIEPGSKLGRVIAIKEELTELLKKITTIRSALNPTSYEPLIAKVTFKLLPTTIKKINKSWTTYFQSIPVSSINEYEQRVNSTIANIKSSGLTIKNYTKNRSLNDLTLDFISINLDALSQQTTTAISQTDDLARILDIPNIIAQASNRRQYRSLPLPPLPPPPSPHLSPLSPLSPVPLPLPPLSPPPHLFAPPGLRRQPNIGTQQTSLVRQQATHLSLDDLDDLDDLRLAQGKKYFKKRRLTRRNKLRGQKSIRGQKSKKHYKTRRA